MPAPEELERLSNLFSLASQRNRPFLDRCSETKYLAVRDYDSAMNVTIELVRQTLQEANSGLRNRDDCKGYLANVRSSVETGNLDHNLLNALEELRSRYLERVLRPAIGRYLRNEDLKPLEIDALYNDALRIEGLLEVVQFLKKVEPVVF